MIIAEARRCQCPHATANIFRLPTAIVPSASVPATAPVAGLSTAPTAVLPTTIASVAALGGDNATSPAQARSRLYRPPLCVGSKALYALGQQTQARNTLIHLLFYTGYHFAHPDLSHPFLQRNCIARNVS